VDSRLRINDIEVFVEGAGPETIVMVHGWPDTHRLWDSQVASLESQYRCVRFTLPGFDIHEPRRAFALADIVSTLKAIVEATSPNRKVALMLHDWGCVFGYQFYMQHPALVSKIIGVDIGDTSSRAFKASLTASAKLAIFTYQVWLACAWRVGGGLGDAMTRAMARAFKAPVNPRLVGSAMNYPYYIQWTGAYGSYKQQLDFVPACPMLFIYGSRKPFMGHSPAWIEALAKNPANQVLALETDHWVMQREPQRFNQAVQDWLKR
jgi:pimeloyl-ACP methyl ester carboxylesterase